MNNNEFVILTECLTHITDGTSNKERIIPETKGKRRRDIALETTLKEVNCYVIINPL